MHHRAAEHRRTNIVRSIKLSNPCRDCCQYFHYSQMQFDHVRGGKVRNVSRMLTCADDRIFAEIAKCELLCANCHAFRTYLRYHGRL